MKCDELHRHSVRGVMFNGEEICGGFAYYDSDEVDEAIAELKDRIHKLENMPHTDNSAVIELLENQNAELREATRWRKCSEEKPECEGDYLVMARYPDDDELHIEICLYESECEDFGHYECRYAGSGDSFGGFDGEEWVTHNVSFWMPLPSAPKEGE